MRVFVDANTLVSGLVFSGPEHVFLKTARLRKFQLVTSEDVVDEVLAVLNRKFADKTPLAVEFFKLAGLEVILRADYAKLVDPQKVRDEKDRHVLAAAIASGCKVILTGDKDLLSIKTLRGISIKTTKELLH